MDTIEDDMTISTDVKQHLLRSFHESMLVAGWSFTGSGPNEKMRQMLVEFHVIHAELLLLEESHLEIIVDITRKMGNGMADYSRRAAVTGQLCIESIIDFDLYCHYAAGLVGEGLTRMFAQPGKDQPLPAELLALANSAGLFVQKVDIIRDFREDIEEQRCFWPKEIWGREVYGIALGRPAFTRMEEMYQPENEHQALWALSGMIVDALKHVLDILDYIHLVQQTQMFEFFALPQIISIARLNRCYMNSTIFHGETDIGRVETAFLVAQSSSSSAVVHVFRKYVRELRNKIVPEDPNYVDLLVACVKIELRIERHCSNVVSGHDGGNTPISGPDPCATPGQLAYKHVPDEDLEARARNIVASGRARSASWINQFAQTLSLTHNTLLVFLGLLGTFLLYKYRV
ncbi:uncharacterized protein FIBRA_05566 [Fibroporia radiculosa]|uniref:Squalene synthase n=1 Tax=Fibroporia radiculosa TaxID=599839 RepID=J4G9Q7_9APHY|nr:uncharacterized protein FIBRA_05566 [Fibroporia radiculosa]CCM03433.1 predicted protein [Fibroporia radiculosa]